MAAGRAHGARVVAYWFPPDPAGSLRRNAARTGRARVPDAGVRATSKRMRRPTTGDGFDAVLRVRFDGRGGFLVETVETAETEDAKDAEDAVDAVNKNR